MPGPGPSSPLFQQDALTAHARRNFGATVGTRRNPRIAAALLALLPTIGLVALALAGNVQPRMTVAGRIVTGAGEIDVTADRYGVVSRILVKEGAHVETGDGLLALGSIVGNAARAYVSDAQRETLLSELSDLDSMQDLLQQKSTGRSEQLAAKAESIRNELEVLDTLQAYADRRVDLLSKSEERTARLADNGYAPSNDLDAVYLQLLEARTRVRTIERERLVLHDRLQEQKFERSAAAKQLREEQLRLNVRREQVRRQLLELDAHSESFLLSPAAGQVGVLLVKHGASVTAGQPGVSIIPADNEPHAELLVPSAHISLVSRGQAVRLRYDGLPMHRYGTFPGQVADIGATPVTRAPDLGPLYRVVVELQHPWPTENGRILRLFPGSSLEADILGQRTPVWHRLIEPLKRSGLLR